jgi:hypothetical protein
MCRCNGANVRRQWRQPLPKVSNYLSIDTTSCIQVIITCLASIRTINDCDCLVTSRSSPVYF